MKENDEDEVEQHVHDTGDGEVIQRALCIADGTQDGGAEVVEHLHRHAQEDDAHIQDRQIDHVLRRAHQLKQRPRQRDADDHQQHAAGQGQQHRGVHRVGDGAVIPRARVARDEHVRADGQADEQADDHVVQRADGAHCGQGFVARKAAHDDGVRRIEQQLQDAREHDGQGKDEHLREQTALRHVHGTVCLFVQHGSAPFRIQMHTIS